MARITDPAVLDLVQPALDETAWDSFDPDKIYLQRECPVCDKGLIYAPARFHEACGGTGFLVRIVNRPRLLVSAEDECPYTFAHTREWCGHPSCREA